MGRLDRKNALITGASRGIGRAIALDLAREGANVTINYIRNRAAAEEVAEEVNKLGSRAFIIKANVGDEYALNRMFKEHKAQFGRLDIFVANAAIATFGPSLSYKTRHFDFALQANPRAFLVCARESFKQFCEQAGYTVDQAQEAFQNGNPPQIGGKIIAITSTGNEHYIPGYLAVGTCKAAIITMVRYFGYDMAPFGVAVNAVSGGPIDTENMKFFDDELKQDWLKDTPTHRLGSANDLSKVVRDLACDTTNWIIGQNIVADGGLGLK